MPETFSSSNYSIWYSLLVVGGSILASLLMYAEWRNKKMIRYHFWILVPILAFFAIYGARWWYLMWNPSDYTGIQDIFIPFYGRSILGTIFFVWIVLWFYCKYWGGEQLEFRQAATIIFPNMLLAQAIGRWGNFANQEVYGLAVESLAWLPDFIEQGMYITTVDPTTGISTSAYRQPLFLYESFANFICWVVIAFGIKNIKQIKPGVAAGVYLVAYGTTRASLELFRDPEFIMHIGNFPTSFFWAIVFAVYGVWIIVYYQIIYEKTDWYLQSSWNTKSIIITK